MGYRLNLELPKEPRPEILQRVLKLLGVLVGRDGDADVEESDDADSSKRENSPGESETTALAGPMLIGRDEAAAQLGISTSTLDRWRKKGLLPVVDLPGAAPMFSRRALKKFVTTNSKITPSRRR